jgi:DNA-binding response OmpR family regulator
MQGAARTRTLLVVDDEPAITRSLVLLFKRRGYRVLVASGGHAALEILEHTRVDCLVLDYRLPDLRGDALYTIIVARQPHLARRIVFLTGDITTEVRDSLERTGCYVIGKPFELVELVTRVDDLLARDDEGAEGAQGAVG